MCFSATHLKPAEAQQRARSLRQWTVSLLKISKPLAYWVALDSHSKSDQLDKETLYSPNKTGRTPGGHNSISSSLNAPMADASGHRRAGGTPQRRPAPAVAGYRRRGWQCRLTQPWSLAVLFVAVAALTSATTGGKDDELAEPRVTIHSVLGGKAGLPCNLQPNSSEDEVSLVLWYKDDSTTPIYSLDARKTTLRNAHHSPVHWLTGRAYLSTSGIASGDASVTAAAAVGGYPWGWPQYGRPSLLLLDPVEAQDDALYRCRVDFRRSRTRNYEVQLVVIVPPTRMTITDHRGTILENNSIIGPYSEGEKLALKCQVHGGKPAPTVTWYRSPAPSGGSLEQHHRLHRPHSKTAENEFSDLMLTEEGVHNHSQGYNRHRHHLNQHHRSHHESHHHGGQHHKSQQHDGQTHDYQRGEQAYFKKSGPLTELGVEVASSRLPTTSPPGNLGTGGGSNSRLGNRHQMVTTVELSVPALGRDDLLAAFSCAASNNNMSRPLVASVVLDIYFRPQRVWISAAPVTGETAASGGNGANGGGGGIGVLSAGVRAAFQCSSSGSRPPALLTWYRGGERLAATAGRPLPSLQATDNTTAGAAAAVGRWHTSIVELVARPEDDGTQLTCHAHNPAVTSLTSRTRPPVAIGELAFGGEPGTVAGEAVADGIVDGITLHVQYVPQLTVRLGKKLRHSHIREGSDVFLECDVKANPALIEMGWRFEGEELTTDTAKGIVISDHSLVLQKVTRLNRGRYTCTGTNSEGQGESPAFHLRVRYEPRCKSGQRQVYGAAKNEAVRLSCELEADPEDVTFKWKTRNSKGVISSSPVLASVGSVFADTPFSSDAESKRLHQYHKQTPRRHGSVYAEGTRSWLTVVPRSEEDYGTVICWGRNAVGAQREPCVFTLIPAGPPGPLHNCSVLRAGDDWITIACVEGYDGGSEQGQRFYLEVHDSANQNRVLIANVSAVSGSGSAAAGNVSGGSKDSDASSSGGVGDEDQNGIGPPMASLTATGLTAGTAYVCTLYAANERGTSQPTILVASTQPRPLGLSSRGESLLRLFDLRRLGHSSPVAVVVAGFAVLTIIVCLILVVVLAKKVAFAALLLKRGRTGSKLPAKTSKKIEEDKELAIPLRGSKNQNEEEQQVTNLKNSSDEVEPSLIEDFNAEERCPDVVSGWLDKHEKLVYEI